MARGIPRASLSPPLRGPGTEQYKQEDRRQAAAKPSREPASLLSEATVKQMLLLQLLLLYALGMRVSEPPHRANALCICIFSMPDIAEPLGTCLCCLCSQRGQERGMAEVHQQWLPAHRVPGSLRQALHTAHCSAAHPNATCHLSAQRPEQCCLGPLSLKQTPPELQISAKRPHATLEGEPERPAAPQSWVCWERLPQQSQPSFLHGAANSRAG